MDAPEAQGAHETAALLTAGGNVVEIPRESFSEADLTAMRALPVALLAALAMAFTAATSYFAYASLLCDDPKDCSGDESGRFAGLVAAATWGANIVGMSALGILQRLVIDNYKRGMLIWVACRSMSVLVLLFGVFANNVYIALSGRIFESLASDNLLHFTLNAVYTQCRDGQASTLIGYSLGLYMIGISISPFVAGLFDSFVTSFLVALGLFGTTIAYLELVVPGQSLKRISEDRIDALESTRTHAPNHHRAQKWWRTSVEPLQFFHRNPRQLPFGICLFFYNTVQSYIFNALLVHTSVRFHFTGKENGVIISIAHSVAALYVFATSLSLPWLSRHFSNDKSLQKENTNTRTRYIVLALVSLGIQASSLLMLPFASKSCQIYFATVLLAIGLPAPSYIKSYFVGLHSGDSRVTALAGLAVMETFGSLLGPISLGITQSTFVAHGFVFFIAALLLLLSILSLILSFIYK